MTPLEGKCYFLLLILVAGLLPSFSYANNPRYKHFLIQHRDDPKSSFSGRYCDSLMSIRHLTTPMCKETNTFIHSSKKQIQAVCDKGGVLHGQLRHSLQPFRVTTCILKGGSTRPPCQYRENTSPRYIVIHCDEGGWPTHYDKSQIVKTV